VRGWSLERAALGTSGSRSRTAGLNRAHRRVNVARAADDGQIRSASPKTIIMHRIVARTPAFSRGRN
jgi:hypothetical protein